MKSALLHWAEMEARNGVAMEVHYWQDRDFARTEICHKKKKSQKISKRRCILCSLFCIFKAFLPLCESLCFFLSLLLFFFFFLGHPRWFKDLWEEGLSDGPFPSSTFTSRKTLYLCSMWVVMCYSWKGCKHLKGFYLFTAYFYACFHSVFVYAKPWDVKNRKNIIFF